MDKSIYQMAIIRQVVSKYLVLTTIACAFSIAFSAEAKSATFFDKLWSLLGFGDNNMCVSINVSGEKYCLPKDRVKRISSGPHVQSMIFFTPSSEANGQVQISLRDESALKNVPKPKTSPEAIFESVTSGRMIGQDRSKIVRQQINALTRDKDVDFFDLNVFVPEIKKKSGGTQRFFSSRNGRIVQYAGSSARTGIYKHSISYSSNYPGELITIKFYYSSNLTKIESVFRKITDIDNEIRALLTDGRI